MTISANEVKTRGVSIFENLLSKFDELVINVRGKDKYIVLNIERYKELRANELDLAYINTLKDIEKGNYKVQTASQHEEELRNAIQNT